MKQAKNDPLVCCPIVCGEFTRATGFFFSDGDTVYLITARHNALPTFGSKLQTDQFCCEFRCPDFLPVIDVYLRTTDKFDVHRLDLRNLDNVLTSPEIDVLAVPFGGNPEAYGYQVWTSDDVSRLRNLSETMDIIGFNGQPFPSPDRDYDIEFYQNNIENPVILNLKNPYKYDEVPIPSEFLAFGIDSTFMRPDDEYNGLSGAPVLGNGLVGIHSQNADSSRMLVDKIGQDDCMITIYTRAEILSPMLCQ